GLIQSARILPPTSQNQARIEADLRALVPDLIQRSQAEATHTCEVAIRNYDPCISCSTHFLKLEIERGAGKPRECSRKRRRRIVK
ncbi:MAG: hypothetical protein ACXWC0_29355, partial [Burkholderiales bacterium]